jgi:hypothetical protein
MFNVNRTVGSDKKSNKGMKGTSAFMDLYRQISLAVVFLILSAASTAAQDNPKSEPEALVTFYSNHITLLGGTPGHRWGAFKGRVFDGDKQLAFIEPAHFVTFRLPVGVHVFTANSWMNKSSKKGSHLKMDIEAGHRYLIECGSFAGSPVFGIREVSCPSAQSAGKDLKPLESVHLRADGSPIVIPETSFPNCPTATVR